jgi:hypothetical protein
MVSVAAAWRCALVGVLALPLLTGCESNPPQPQAQAAPPKAQLQFSDLQGFDRELSSSLAAPLPAVNVAFYDRITPSTMPERLQKWMAAVESGGGKVKITPPPSTVTAKSPFLIFSAANAVFNFTKASKEAADAAQFAPARTYDADIQLKVDERGDTVVDKVVFSQRGK